MDVSMLQKALQELQIPQHLYNIDGKGRDDERLCLSCADGKWTVYYAERGVKTTNIVFDTESEACTYMYQKLYEGMLLEMENMWIPVGSVVLLKGAARKLLIIARAINVQHNGKQFFFDYGAVSYPEGLQGDQMAYFNKDAVAKVVFAGYHDIEDENMVDSIQAYIQEHPDMVKGSSDLWENER